MLVQQILKAGNTVCGVIIDDNNVSFDEAVKLYNKGYLTNVILVGGRYFRGKHGYHINIEEVGSNEVKGNAGNLGQIYGKGRLQSSNRKRAGGTISGVREKGAFDRGGKGGSKSVKGHKRGQGGSGFWADDSVRLRLTKLGCRCYKQVSSVDFSRDFARAKSLHPNSACVDSHSEKELSSMKCLRTDNGFVAVETDGNINSVLKDVSKPNSKGFLLELLLNATVNGARKLDCFAIMKDKRGGLADMYCRHGFVPVVRDKFNCEFAPDNWDYEKDGEPDVVFMYYCGDSPEIMAEKSRTGKYKGYLDYDIPYIYDVERMRGSLDKNNSYDMCLLYRDWVMEHNTR